MYINVYIEVIKGINNCNNKCTELQRLQKNLTKSMNKTKLTLNCNV